MNSAAAIIVNIIVNQFRLGASNHRNTSVCISVDFAILHDTGVSTERI